MGKSYIQRAFDIAKAAPTDELEQTDDESEEMEHRSYLDGCDLNDLRGSIDGGVW